MNEAQKRGYNRVIITTDTGGWMVGTYACLDGVGSAWNDDCSDYWHHVLGVDCDRAPANTLTTGQTYTMASGRKMRVIHIEDGKAFGVFLNDDGTASLDSAYTWDMDGIYQNAIAGVRDEYRIVFEPVRTYRRIPVQIEGDGAYLHYTTIDGKFDPSSVRVEFEVVT